MNTRLVNNINIRLLHMCDVNWNMHNRVSGREWQLSFHIKLYLKLTSTEYITRIPISTCTFMYIQLKYNCVFLNYIGTINYLLLSRYNLSRYHTYYWYTLLLILLINILPLTAKYLQTKVHLNANSSLKVICQTRCLENTDKAGNTMIPLWWA